jgi:hypothetical protein
MPLPKSDAMLISCKAISPFVDVELLQKKQDGTVEPKDTAPAVEIDAVLKRLEHLDDEYDLHAIPSVLDYLHKSCWDAGYSLKMGTQQLLDNTQIETVDDMAGEVSRRSFKV